MLLPDCPPWRRGVALTACRGLVGVNTQYRYLFCDERPGERGDLTRLARPAIISTARHWTLYEWFEADSIVHGISELLLAAKVSLCCANADVPEQELDLVKLSTGIMAHARAR